MESKKQPKKKVYVETTVISDATALPSKDLILAGRQILSREWLERAMYEYELYSSCLVRREALKGDEGAAARRMAALTSFRELQADDRAQQLAVKLIEGKAIPKEYPDDALHRSAS